MKIKKIFAALLSLAMVLTMLPATAMAADGETTVGSSGVATNKTATLTDDGTYTINLEAYATGSTTTVTTPVKSGVPLDIVLVLDQSGSMSGDLRNLRTAVNSFITSIESNASEYNVDHRIAIVGFAGAEYSNRTYYYANSELFVGRTQYNYMRDGRDSTYNSTGNLASDHYDEAFQTVTTEAGRTNLSNSVSALAANGGTHPEVGFDMANGIFAANDNTYIDADGETAERRRIVVMFTDGQPGDDGFDSDIAEETIAEAYATKNTYDATIYTVGLYNNASQNVTKFMNRVSSNYPDAQTFNDNGHYEYTPVYNVNTNRSYFIASGNNYQEVRYYETMFAGEGWRTSRYGDNYTPKTSANSSGTQFYERTWVTSKPTPVDTKYYMTTNDSSELGNIFTNISEDVTSGSSTTTVTLDAEAVLRDVMANGLVMTDATKITVKTASATAAVGSDNQVVVTEGSETDTAASVTAQKVDAKTVTVTGFNYSEKYIATGHPGEILKVEITGVIPTAETATDQVIDTNDSVSGIYDKEGELGATFPQPKTILTSKAYVLDYAKETALTGLDQNTSVTAIVDTMRAVSAADNAVTGTYGNSALSQNSVSYTPKTTSWDGYDNLYVFGETTNETVTSASANANGNLWSKVSVIPANNVYYEDDFVTDTTSGTVGIEYTGNWTTTGSKDGNTETANGDVQGWETSLANDATYSDGSAHVSSTSGATATFTFTGTGVDIYSRTDMTTGTVLATLTGSDDAGTSVSKYLIVDNYAESYDDGDSTADGYYQIPTLSFDGLDHGTYTVSIRVTTAADTRSTYYLDGIRVYNPIKDLESDETVQNAYGADELNASFTQVRDMLDSSSTVFIDEDANGNAYAGDYDESTYEQYGPKNEVYLAAGQAIVFNVSGNGSYYVGLKAPAGETKAVLSADANAAETTIGHASDLYYRVTPDSNGYVTIKNNGSNLLAVTKLRTAGSGAVAESLDAEAAVQAYNAFSLLDVVSYDSSPVTDDELTGNESEDSSGTVPEEPGDVEIENPGDYDDTETQEPEQTTPTIGNWINKLFSSIKDLFSRW